MKLYELKVERLKRELSKLELSTTGTKNELQRRLMEELRLRGFDIDTYEFDDDEERDIPAPATPSNFDISTMFAALMEENRKLFDEAQARSRKLSDEAQARSSAEMRKLLGEAQERSGAENGKLIEEIRDIKENQKLVTEVQEKSRADIQKLSNEVRENRALVKENTKATADKLQEIYETVSKRITGVEEKVSNLEKAVDEKLVVMEERLNNLQSQRPEPMRIVSEGIGRIKTPCFDGSSPLSVFKFQFETVASRNGWGDDEKALELILALKGVAAEILETMPANCRNNYNDLMVALQRKFGDEHKRELYRMELRCRAQKANESLQAFAMEVERLVQLTYPGENHPLIDNFKTEAFVNGIRDPDIKLAVCSTQKTTFAETVAFALAQETARTISRPQVSKVRRMEVEEEDECLLSKFKEMMKQVLAENGQKAKLKCFNCGKGGHFQRNCKAPRKRSRSVSPSRQNKRADYQPSTQESPLN